MSEMQGIEQKQAETTKGIAETTAAIKDMSSKNEESNTGIKAGLNAIVKAGLVASKADRIARKATQRAAIDAAAHYAEMQKLAAEGNASAEDLAAAQEVAAKTAAEAAEAAEKQSMLDRFDDDEAPDVGPAADPKKTGGTIKKLGKKLGGLALLLLGLLGLLLNTPAFKVISKALDDLIDWFASPDNPLTKFFKSIIDGFGDLFKGNFKEGFAKIGKALEDGLTAAIKSIFGIEFEGNVSDVLKKFVGSFIRGIANILPDNFNFGLKKKLLGLADALDPAEAIRLKKIEAENKAERDRLDIDFEGEGEDILAREQAEQLKKLPGDFREMIQNLNNIPKAVLKSVQEGKLTMAEGAMQLRNRGATDSTGLPKKRAGESQVGYQRRLESFRALAEQQAREVMPEGDKIRAEIDDKQVKRDLLKDRVDRSLAGEDEFFGSERTSRRVANKEILALNEEIGQLNNTLKEELSKLAPVLESVTSKEGDVARAAAEAKKQEVVAQTVINNMVAPTNNAGDKINVASGNKGLTADGNHGRLAAALAGFH
jgi:hypothetical protein